MRVMAAGVINVYSGYTAQHCICNYTNEGQASCKFKMEKIMILKEIVHTKKQADWEEIPKEELWEDGELNAVEVQHKIIFHTMQEGDWILIRRIEQ